ncbi:MAG TPA: tripartite tricarboxylate transporter substrate binding protein [Burkholderiales bacterium]|jgi:tripartite-type tricarboxylate transporter receptor subunit TctC
MKSLTAAALLCAACALPAAHAQENFPSKPINIEVGSAPGGSNDTFARAIAKRMTDTWHQPVLVDNRPASQGLLANTYVAKAAPDGYTIVVLSSTFSTSAAIMNTLQYDPLKSFAPVAMLAKGPLLVTVSNTTPFKSLADVIGYAKAHPEKINYATSGVGSINNFATILFADAAGIKITHVPYKGMGPAVVDLIGGQTQLLIGSAPSIGAQVKAGKVRAIGITSARPSPVAPDLPTLESAGVKGASVDLWWGVLAPAGTPVAVVNKLNAEINRIIKGDDMKEFFLREGAEPSPGTPADFSRLIESEIARWKRVAKAANIQPE